MNDVKNYEKIIEKRTEGKLLLLRIGLIIGYVAFAIIGFALVFTIGDSSPALFLLVGAADSLFIFLSWPLTCIEYEYDIIAGSIYLARIYGKSRRKEIFECELSRAAIIAPYNERYAEKAERCQPNNIFRAVSSNKAENVWFIIFEEDGARKTLLFLEVDERALTTLRHYCPRATAREKLTVNDPNESKGDDENA